MIQARHASISATQSVERIFQDFFQRFGYVLLQSSPLVDVSIPMSFVMSAGWVQIEKRAKAQPDYFQNIAVVQNCFRHFDMKKVGESPIHLSLFRMLGAFHFGKIIPQEQISRIWTLLINEYALPPGRLWATYFTGGEIGGYYFAEDQRILEAWQDTDILKKHIVGNPDKQNFWHQSLVGQSLEASAKCGSTTEIFFDRGEEHACGPNCLPGCPCGRFVEIVNILFIQWQITPKQEVKTLFPLFTEIVLGSERMAMIQQDVDNIFKIDILSPLVKEIEYRQSFDVKVDDRKHIYFIADHLRALAFLIADGAPPPGKGGRAFIIRKLMREIFTSMKILGIENDSFLQETLEKTIFLYAPIHPDITSVQMRLLKYLEEESNRFEATLQRGERRLDRLISRLPEQFLPEQELLKLEKSFGVPHSLLLRMLEERHIHYAELSQPVSYQENIL